MFSDPNNRTTINSAEKVLQCNHLNSTEIIVGDEKGYLSLISLERRGEQLFASEQYFSTEKSFVRRLTGMMAKYFIYLFTSFSSSFFLLPSFQKTIIIVVIAIVSVIMFIFKKNYKKLFEGNHL